MSYTYSLSTFDRQHPTTVRLPTELKLRGKAQAVREQRTFTEVMTDALVQYLERTALVPVAESQPWKDDVKKRLQGILSVIDVATPEQLARLLESASGVAIREIV